MVYRSVFRGHLSSFVRVLSLLVLRGGMIDLIDIIPEHFLSFYITLEKCTERNGLQFCKLQEYSIVFQSGNCIVALLFYVHGTHLRSCRDGQLT